MAFLIKPGSTVLFVGDSVADNGSRSSNPLPDTGYVGIIGDLVSHCHPGHNLKLVNAGVCSDTVGNLSKRWTEDVIRRRPDWVSILIGIGDIHQGLTGETPQPDGPAEFAGLYGKLIERTRKETQAQIVLLTPFCISADRACESYGGHLLRHLPPYLGAVRGLAERYKTHLVDFYALFQRLLATFPPDRFGTDAVHPNRSGHLLMAYEWLSVMKF